MNNPGDIRISAVTITSPYKDVTLDISQSIKQIDIFEDIDAPTMLCNILVHDDVNLLANLPVVGEEDIRIAFNTPSYDIVSFNFKVYEVDNESVPNDLSAKVYVLRCVSNESIENAKRNVDTALVGSVDDLVEGVLKNYTKSNKNIIVERSKGTESVVFPAKTAPFQAVDYLRRKAISATYDSSSYVFFENQRGFNFVTVEHLMDTGQKRETIDGIKTYTYQPIQRREHKTDIKLFRNIIKYTVLGRTDTVHKLTSGAYKTDVRSFDVVTKQLTQNQYSIADFSFKASDKASRFNNTAKELASILREISPAHIIYGAKAADVATSFVDNVRGARHIYSSLLGETTILALFYGDSSMKVGDVIKLNLLSSEVFDVSDKSATKNKDRDLERNIAGNYLITKLRHNIVDNGNFSYHISARLVKVGGSV